ncbi:MAG: DUF262 domain-containing protein [Candidatus Limnocylindrales bacterium]|nr:DUF262 domain-containing protein [Candidatus Limnocylindrales bacterium]
MRCVLAHHFSVAKALAWKGALYDDPPYQRESSVWPLDKQQLFVDSLLNGFDVPKIYLHDLRGKHPTKVYAVVDGKQRLNAIWRFLADEIPLADDFRFEPGNAPDLPPGTRPPIAGSRFSEFDPRWQEVLRSTHLSVVLIQNAAEEDIEELFARLNNGAPLNAAEKRNARGGDMAALVRDVARRPFFTDWLTSTNARYQHFDLAARFLLIEQADPGGDRPPPNLKPRALDAFFESNRHLSASARRKLLQGVGAGLDLMEQVFVSADPLLRRPSHPPLYYLFVRSVAAEQPAAVPGLRDFIDRFQRTRLSESRRPGGGRDLAIVDFNDATQRGTNDPRSLARRVEILEERFRADLEMTRRSA